MALEIRVREGDEEITEYDLIADGHLISEDAVRLSRSISSLFENTILPMDLSIENLNNARPLLNCRLIDLLNLGGVSEIFNEMNVLNPLPSLSGLTHACHIFRDKNKDLSPGNSFIIGIRIYLNTDNAEWQDIVNTHRYAAAIIPHMEEFGFSASMTMIFTGSNIHNHPFSPNFEIPSTYTLDEVIKAVDNAFAPLHHFAIATVEAQKHPNSVSLHFEFPDAVKVPCEQYLLYFAQFLKDVGIGATANIQHEAGQVLFTVTPDNPDQALDKIREALAVYLRLPTAPAGSLLPTTADPIEVQRMGANLQFLQGQLMLANALTMSQQTTIQNLQGIISQQQQAMSCMVDGSIFLQALEMAYIAGGKGSQKPDKDVEAILGNTVEITKLELKNFGVNVNLPVIYRALKNLLIESDLPTPPAKGLTAGESGNEGDIN